MLFRDPHLVCALGLTLAQQLLLSFSTYFIAQAGSALAVGTIDPVLHDISLFFIFALLAYVSSSAACLLTTRAANRIWHNYTHTTVRDATLSLQYASDKNRQSIAQWLGGEAPLTIAQACDFHREMLSAGLNVLFTLAVFYLAVGWQIASAIAASLVASLALVLVQRQRIERSAAAMQQRRLAAMLSIEPAWTCSMFGSRRMRADGLRILNEKTHRYFREINKYALLEQLVACGPIIISTLALIGIFQFTDLFTASIAGALVALLPRSLQVFGNVHSLSIYLSQFFLVRAKLRNLDGFCARLEKYPQMHETPMPSVFVLDTYTQKQIPPGDLLQQVHRTRNGRYLVTGANGSGKSSLLKVIKERAADAILFTPETHFLESGRELSTGQRRIKEIENVLSTSPALLMLDEWDANLDESNRRKVDQLLDEASRRLVVIEVRHLRPGPHPSAERSCFDPSTGSGLRTNGG